jgi:AraC-like DNA-binding protein
MIACGTATFTDPEEFRVRVPGANINLVLTGRGEFKARLTWMNLRRLNLVRIEESLPRIAFLALAPGPIFMTFPSGNHFPVLWGGVEMGPREIVLHSPGDRIHQRTGGPSRWGIISLAPKDLAAYGRTLTLTELRPLRAATILRPPSAFAAELLRLHAQACRLAESKPDAAANQEVARALEQDFLHALINCLTAEETHRDDGARRRHADIMARFEDVLASHCHEHLPVPELCASVGVQERKLRVCCAEFLGMSPGNYGRLRRLNLVRTTLRRGDPATATVAEVARRYGFSELGRFAGEYRMVFGEAPSATMRAHQ